MKKYNLFKIIGFMFLFVLLLTWLIPVGGYENGTFITNGTSPVGIFDIIRIPIITFSNLIQYGLLVLIIGGFYGVLNKTLVYANLVEKIKNKINGKEKKFIIALMVILTTLSALIGIQSLFLIIAPFLITVTLELGFSKIVALVSTFGSILIGNICAIYGSSTSYYINDKFHLSLNDEIITKIIFFIIVVFIFVSFVMHNISINKKDKKNKKESNDELIPLYENVKSKKSILPLIVTFTIFMLILLISTINWRGLFEINIFSELYNNLMTIKIGNYPIMANILSSINEFGAWNQYDVSILIILMTICIGWLYSVKFDDFLEGYVSGAKQMLLPAFYVILANIVFVTLYRLQMSENIYFTITNFILTLFDGAKIIFMPLVSLIGAIFYPDLSSLATILSGVTENIITDTTKYQLIGFIVQTMHGIMMLIIPTSMMLVMGLSYLKISFKEWFKYIWKLLLEIFIVTILVIIIVAIFV